MLTSQEPEIPFVPSRKLLVEALRLHTSEMENHTNWSNAEQTFPMVMKTAIISEFFPSIISGIVISVGGLTESIAKPATKALLDWARSSGGTGDSAARANDIGNGMYLSLGWKAYIYVRVRCSHSFLTHQQSRIQFFLTYFEYTAKMFA